MRLSTSTTTTETFTVENWGTGSMNLSVEGQGYKSGGGSWAATSDARLKNVEGDYRQGLDAMVRLHPVKFHYKKDSPRHDNPDKQYVGLVAQDVQPVFPEAVFMEDDGFYSMDTTPITFAVINAIKELKAANDNLRAEHDAELNALREEIEALKASLAAASNN
jgi:hypothetical protein